MQIMADHLGIEDLMKELEDMSMTSESNMVQSRDYGFGKIVP